MRYLNLTAKETTLNIALTLHHLGVESSPLLQSRSLVDVVLEHGKRQIMYIYSYAFCSFIRDIGGNNSGERGVERLTGEDGLEGREHGVALFSQGGEVPADPGEGVRA